MAYTDNFRRQHDEVLALARHLVAQLRPTLSVADAREVRAALSALAGKLSVHLAMEDKALYPRMQQAQADGSREMATLFAREMGGLAGAFGAYNETWSAAAIASEPARFARDTREIFAALSARIERENTRLYPLADRVLARPEESADAGMRDALRS